MFDIKTLEKLKADFFKLGEQLEKTKDPQIIQNIETEQNAIKQLILALILYSEGMELLS